MTPDKDLLSPEEREQVISFLKWFMGSINSGSLQGDGLESGEEMALRLLSLLEEK